MNPDPFRLVANLLTAVLDPAATAESRVQACEQLRRLPGHALRTLSASPEGKALAEVLRSAPAAGAARSSGTSAEAASPAPELPSYAYDIAALINDDWGSRALIPEEKIPEDATPSERIRLCAETRAGEEVGARTYIRQLPWILLNHGAALIVYAEGWKRSPSLLEAYWAECMERSPHLGTPRRLAEYLNHTFEHSPSRRDWFDRAAQWVEDSLAQVAFSFVEVPHLTEIHFTLRAGMAGWIRRAELTDPRMVAAMEIYTASRLIRHAAHQDLRKAWQESGGDAEVATRLWARHNNEGDLMGISAVESLFSPAAHPASEAISRFDRQSLALVRQIWLRNPALTQNGILRPA